MTVTAKLFIDVPLVGSVASQSGRVTELTYAHSFTILTQTALQGGRGSGMTFGHEGAVKRGDYNQPQTTPS